MVQPISPQSLPVSEPKTAEKTNSSETDDFHSVMQSVSQKPDSADGTKESANTGRTVKKQSEKSGRTDQAQTVAGQAPQNALQQSVSVIPGQTALFSSAQICQSLCGTALPGKGGDSASQKVKTSESAPGQAVPSAGTAVSVLPKGSAISSGQILPEKTTGSESLAGQPALAQAVAETSAQKGEKTGTSAASSTGTGRPESAAALKLSDAGQSSISNETAAVSQESAPSAARQTLKSVSQTAAGKDSAAPQGTAGLETATKNPDGKNQVQSSASGEKRSSGGDAAANSLSNLYGNGNVVIRVSGDTAKAELSPAHQVADAAAYQLKNGKSEFQMDLYPQSLGKVSLKLTSQNGLLTVEIAASNPKTQSLLLSGSAEIRSLLQASTGQNVQTVLPGQQTAQWYGQPQDSGGNSGGRRQKREESRQSKTGSVGSVSSELNTGDFLAMIQQIGALARS